MAYSPNEIVEEAHVDFEHCIPFIEKYPVTWINIVDLDEKDIPTMERLFKLHPLALEDSLDETQLPKVDEYDEEIFIVSKVIHWDRDSEYRGDQLSMFLSRKFVITIHREELPQLAEVKQRLRKGSPRMLKGGPDHLALNILDAIVDSYLPTLDRLSDLMDELEDEVVDRPKGDVLPKIHAARRTILHLRKDLNPQRDALHNLWRSDLPYIRKETRSYIRDVYDHANQFLEILETYRELTADVYQIYLSGVQVELNTVIRLLTVIATVSLPFVVLPSMWGMNVALPLAAEPFAFWAITALTAGFVGVMLLYFWRRGWL